MKRFWSIILAALLLISGSALALNNTHDNLEAAGFEPLEKKSYGAPYTMISVPEYDYPVLAFETVEGTAYRLYGKIGRVTGFFPASLEVAQEEGTDGERFVLRLLDTTPVKGDQKLAAKLTLMPAPAEEKPEGFDFIGKSESAIKMVNIFGVTEMYVYGTYGDPEDASAARGWYPSSQQKAINGALRVNLSDSVNRIRPWDVKQKKLPKEYKAGFQQQVSVTSSNGFPTQVATAYPALDYVALAAEVKQEQETKTGTFNVVELVSIPFETTVKANKDRYTNEVDVVLQEGREGTKQITWRVKYENGVEVSRKAAGEKVLEKAVKQIVERGTKEPDEEYIFGSNASIQMTIGNNGTIYEGDTLSVQCSIDITGSKPAKGYKSSLVVTDENGKVLKKTMGSNANPGKISLPKMAQGTYQITAEATVNNSEDAIRYTAYVKVAAKDSNTTGTGSAAPPQRVGAMRPARKARRIQLMRQIRTRPA